MEFNKCNWLKSLVKITALISLVLASGCWQRSVKVNLTSDAKLNPSATHKSLPVVVKVYQLSEPEAFEKASFQELWKKDELTLADAIIAKKEIILQPKAKEYVRFAKKEEATHIGVIALFREPGKFHWKGITPINRGLWAKRVTIQLKGNELTIQ